MGLFGALIWLVELSINVVGYFKDCWVYNYGLKLHCYRLLSTDTFAAPFKLATSIL